MRHILMAGVENPERCGVCGHVWPCPDMTNEQLLREALEALSHCKATLDMIPRNHFTSRHKASWKRADRAVTKLQERLE